MDLMGPSLKRKSDRQRENQWSKKKGLDKKGQTTGEGATGLGRAKKKNSYIQRKKWQILVKKKVKSFSSR